MAPEALKKVVIELEVPEKVATKPEASEKVATKLEASEKVATKPASTNVCVGRINTAEKVTRQ